MKITNRIEYYKALLEREELLGEESEDVLEFTEVEKARFNEINDAISLWEEEQKIGEPEELTERYWIETTDRTDFVISIVQILLEHPCIAQTPELAEKTQKAQDLLFEVYQEAASKY